MPKFLTPISLAALVAFAGPTFAQDATTTETPPAPDTEEAVTLPEADGTPPEADAADDADAPDADLAMGEEVDPQNRPGASYTAETFGDWEQRCIRTEDGNDPCQLYQLLRDGNDNAVAEISIFSLPEGREAAAGSTIITPLETLLTRQVTLGVDAAPAKRYPFEFCAEAGCFSRIGFTDAEVLAFKRGSTATLTIVPAAAPDQTIELDISLSGFTAGYDATEAKNVANEVE